MSTTQRPNRTAPPFHVAPRRRPSRRARLARTSALVAVAALGGWAALGTLTTPGSASLGVKFVEWVRSHGGASFVAWLENTWYSLHQPPTGGKPPAQALEPASHVTALSNGPLPPPPRVQPFAQPPLPHEGVWTPEGPLVHGTPALYVTLMRPDPIHTSLVAGVAWLDTRLLRFIQYAGAQQPPGGGPWPYMAPITTPVADYLVAAFNSGFRMQDANGGYYAYGRMAVPLRNGAAHQPLGELHQLRALGRHRWQPAPRLALRSGSDERRRARLRHRSRPLGCLARPAAPARRSRQRHGARHQLRLDGLLLLQPPARSACLTRQRLPTRVRHAAPTPALLRRHGSRLRRGRDPPKPRDLLVGTTSGHSRTLWTTRPATTASGVVPRATLRQRTSSRGPGCASCLSTRTPSSRPDSQDEYVPATRRTRGSSPTARAWACTRDDHRRRAPTRP